MKNNPTSNLVLIETVSELINGLLFDDIGDIGISNYIPISSLNKRRNMRGYINRRKLQDSNEISVNYTITTYANSNSAQQLQLIYNEMTNQLNNVVTNGTFSRAFQRWAQFYDNTNLQTVFCLEILTISPLEILTSSQPTISPTEGPNIIVITKTIIIIMAIQQQTK